MPLPNGSIAARQAIAPQPSAARQYGRFAGGAEPFGSNPEGFPSTGFGEAVTEGSTGILSVTLRGAASSMDCTGAMKRYPRLESVSMYRGLSGESPNASRTLFTAVPKP